MFLIVCVYLHITFCLYTLCFCFVVVKLMFVVGVVCACFFASHVFLYTWCFCFVMLFGLLFFCFVLFACVFIGISRVLYTVCVCFVFVCLMFVVDVHVCAC